MPYEKFSLVAGFVLPETSANKFCGWGEPDYSNRREEALDTYLRDGPRRDRREASAHPI